MVTDGDGVAVMMVAVVVGTDRVGEIDSNDGDGGEAVGKEQVKAEVSMVIEVIDRLLSRS